MPIDLAPYDLILRDWGIPAQLRKAVDRHTVTTTALHPVTVIPQTVRLTQTDTIANLQGTTRNFLIQGTVLPPSLDWLDCELIVESRVYRVLSAEDSGSGGWVLLETRSLSPLPSS